MGTIDETLAEREPTHGEWVCQATTAWDIKASFRANPGWADLLCHQQEALDHIALKISRILNGDHYHADHWHDIAGYAKLVERELIGK